MKVKFECTLLFRLINKKTFELWNDWNEMAFWFILASETSNLIFCSPELWTEMFSEKRNFFEKGKKARLQFISIQS